jgi:hypothetical protein
LATFTSANALSLNPTSGSDYTLGTSATGTLSLFNTNPTTVNAFGNAGNINIGPSGPTATTVNIAGGSSATGCTIDGSNGNLDCSGAITSNGQTITNLWKTSNGNLSPLNSGDTISATSSAGTVATFTQLDSNKLALDVQGSATLSGTLHLATVDGGGLTDCQGGNKKLQYNATTKKFECIANASLVKPFTNTNSATLVITAGTNYWVQSGGLPAIPSTTLVNSADSVLVQGTVNFANIGGTNKNLAIQIWANTSGATPTCGGASPNYQVGGTLANLASAAGGAAVISFSLVYAPGTSNVAFTICSDVTSQQTGNVARIDMQLQEITTSDLAELYPTTQTNLSAGDILTSDPILTSGVMESTTANDSNLMGVFSTKPAQIIGGADIPSGYNAAILALSGRVPVKVTNLNGNLNVGDAVTSSNLPGIGMRQTQPGTIVGKVIEPVAAWTEGTCPVVDSVEDVESSWPFDENGSNNAHPCFAVPTSQVPGVPSTYTKPYVYFGKVMIKVDKGYNIPKFLADAASVNLQLLSSSAVIGTGSASLANFLLVDKDNNIITNSQSFSDILAANGTFGSLTTDHLRAQALQTPKLDIGQISISSSTDSGKLVFTNEDHQEIVSINDNGDTSFSGTITALNGSNLAQDYPTKDDSFEAGDIVTMDKSEAGFVKKSQTSYDNEILGVYSSNAGLRFMDNKQGAGSVPVAITGKALVKAIGENGDIHKGDYLVTSSTAGVAMKATRPGVALGRALEDFACTASPGASTCSGKILVSLNVSYVDPKNVTTPDDQSTVARISSQEIALPEGLKVDGKEINGTLGDALSVISASLAFASDNISALQENMLGIASQSAALDARVANLEASASAQIAQTQSLTETVFDGISSLSKRIDDFVSSLTDTSSTDLNLTPPETLIATESATLASIDVTSDAKISISGTISLNGALSITNHSINVIETHDDNGNKLTDGILYLQNSPLAGPIDLLNGAVIIDRNGTMFVRGDIKIGGNLNIEGAITITATAGEDIKAGDVLYVSASGVVKKADATDHDRLSAVGISAKDAKAGTKVTIIIAGKVKGLTDLKAGKRYYLGIDGDIAENSPINAVKSIPIGIAFSTNELIVQISQYPGSAVGGVSTSSVQITPTPIPTSVTVSVTPPPTSGETQSTIAPSPTPTPTDSASNQATPTLTPTPTVDQITPTPTQGEQ